MWIPMASILGGQHRCGFGWHMFVEALAEGRGVSLPAAGLGAAKALSCGVGAYARVRKQFRVPLAEFGGIQESLARAGRESYIIVSGVDLMNAIIDNHEAPMLFLLLCCSVVVVLVLVTVVVVFRRRWSSRPS